MAQSLAFWFDREDESNGNLPEVELHFNYWSLPNTKYDYLDIGVKLAQLTEESSDNPPEKTESAEQDESKFANVFKSLNFYLPFNKEDIEYHYELGELVCKEDELIPAIFNGELLSKDVYQTGQYELNISNFQRPLRVITQIQEDQEGSFQGVKISNLFDEPHKGVQLSFPVELFKLTNRKKTTEQEQEHTTAPDRYIRFRVVIKQGKGNPLSSIEPRKGAFLTGNFERDEIVDFRINESRNLPGTVRAQLFENSNIKLVHFFLIRDSSNDLKISHTSYKRCRILENGLWNSYLCLSSKNGAPFAEAKGRFRNSLNWIKRKIHLKSSKPAQISENDRTLIYHWSEKEKTGGKKSLDHFAAFSKFTSTRTKYLHLLRFAVAVLVIGMVASYLSNLIPPYLNSGKDNVECIGEETKNTIHSGADMDNSNLLNYMLTVKMFSGSKFQCAEKKCKNQLGPYCN